MRAEFRDVARLRRDPFLAADILSSMPLQAGRCRAERFHVLPAGKQFVQLYMSPFSCRNPAGPFIIKIVRWTACHLTL